jgi:phytoene dehydrogenase-like protein
MDPIKIESLYSGKQGSIYGNASNSKSAAFYRHPNFSKKLKGLYFTGVTVHPGGGIPLALNSAKIVERCVKDDFEL